MEGAAGDGAGSGTSTTRSCTTVTTGQDRQGQPRNFCWASPANTENSACPPPAFLPLDEQVGLSLAGPSPPIPGGPKPKVSPGRFRSLQVPVRPLLLPSPRLLPRTKRHKPRPLIISRAHFSNVPFLLPSVHSFHSPPLFSGFRLSVLSVCCSHSRFLQISKRPSRLPSLDAAADAAGLNASTHTSPWSFLHCHATQPKSTEPETSPETLSLPCLTSPHSGTLPPVNSADTGPTQTKTKTAHAVRAQADPTDST
jgi:hypothetical protein